MSAFISALLSVVILMLLLLQFQQHHRIKRLEVSKEIQEDVQILMSRGTYMSLLYNVVEEAVKRGWTYERFRTVSESIWGNILRN